MKCSECERDFPSELLHPMCINGEYTDAVCAICALRIRNELHGLPPDTPFTGTIAQEMYEKALEYLKK